MWIGCYLVCQWGLLLCLLGFVIVVVWLETQWRIQNFGTASMKYFRSLQLAKGLVDGNTGVSSDSWHLSLPESSGNILWGLAEKRPSKMAMRRVVGEDRLFIGMQQSLKLISGVSLSVLFTWPGLEGTGWYFGESVYVKKWDFGDGMHSIYKFRLSSCSNSY